jgi:protein-S-isoprenylcysteine O-methyltransferase Ste14
MLGFPHLQCSNVTMNGGVLMDVFMTVLGLLLVVASFVPSLKVSGIFSRDPGLPATFAARAWCFVAGLLFASFGLWWLISCA